VRIQSVYQIDYADSVELFTESESASIDFDSAFAGGTARVEAAARSRELLGTERPAAELFFPDESFSVPVYEAPALRAALRRVYRRAAEGARPASAAALGFLYRYPRLSAAFRAGALAEAGRAIDRSRKLAPFSPLLRWRFSGDALLAFALYWMNEFDGDKETVLGRLLAGEDPRGYRPRDPQYAGFPEDDRKFETPRYAAAYAFAAASIASSDLPSFRLEAAGALRDRLLVRREPIVLPVVGAGFRPALASLAELLSEAAVQARRRFLTEGLSGAEARIDSYVEGLTVLISPEPYNATDPHALAVLLRSGDGRTERAGYLKREVSAALAPLVAEGAALQARFARITEDGEADVELRAG